LSALDCGRIIDQRKRAYPPSPISPTQRVARKGFVVPASLRDNRTAPSRDPDTIDPDHRMIQASSVAARYDISVRTLDRWLQAPHRAFPPPTMKTRDITGRVASRFWRLGDLVAWEKAQGANCAASHNNHP
jgi:hypothetical protein